MVKSDKTWNDRFDAANSSVTITQMNADALFDLLEQKLDIAEDELKRLAQQRISGTDDVAEHKFRWYRMQKEQLEKLWNFLQSDTRETYDVAGYTADIRDTPLIVVKRLVRVHNPAPELTDEGYVVGDSVTEDMDYVSVLVASADVAIDIDRLYRRISSQVNMLNQEYRPCRCKDCNTLFAVSKKEDRFMANKGLVARKRCSDCVAKRKAEKALEAAKKSND